MFAKLGNDDDDDVAGNDDNDDVPGNDDNDNVAGNEVENVEMMIRS